jgi:hypothetical protein
MSSPGMPEYKMYALHFFVYVLGRLFFFENGLYYLKVKYYTQPLHSEDAHSRLKQDSDSSKKINK